MKPNDYVCEYNVLSGGRGFGFARNMCPLVAKDDQLGQVRPYNFFKQVHEEFCATRLKQLKRAGELWREKGRFGDGEITIMKTANAEKWRETKNRSGWTLLRVIRKLSPGTCVCRGRSCRRKFFGQWIKPTPNGSGGVDGEEMEKLYSIIILKKHCQRGLV